MKTEQMEFSIGNTVQFGSAFEKPMTEFERKGLAIKMLLPPGPFIVVGIIPVPPEEVEKVEHPQLLELVDAEKKSVCIAGETISISGAWLEKALEN